MEEKNKTVNFEEKIPHYSSSGVEKNIKKIGLYGNGSKPWTKCNNGAGRPSNK